jgi:hypothetical protein
VFIPNGTMLELCALSWVVVVGSDSRIFASLALGDILLEILILPRMRVCGITIQLLCSSYSFVISSKETFPEGASC